jgi:uncharacterized protein involved in exopolysaccharide biosynthesis
MVQKAMPELVATTSKPNSESMSLLRIASTVLRSWRMVIALPLLLALLVGIYTLTRPRQYYASASFLPKTMDASSARGAAALAQQFGVNIGGDRPGESPQFYLDLIRNRSILRQVVEHKYTIESESGARRQATLVDLYDVEGDAVVPAWRKAAEELSNQITASSVKETGLVQFTVSAPQPKLAEQVAERLLNVLNGFNTELRRSRAEEEGRFIRGRVEDARTELLAAERALQNFLVRNREFRNSPQLAFENERLERQVEMRQEVYSSLVRSQEQARVDAVRDAR